MAVKEDLAITNETELHARPASDFVKLVKSFKLKVTAACKGNKVDAKRILGIMNLAARRNATITITAGENKA